MNILKRLFYIVILILVKIGDSVIFLLSQPKIQAELLFQHIKIELSSPIHKTTTKQVTAANYAVSKKTNITRLKKKKTLYKAPKPSNWKFLIIKKIRKKILGSFKRFGAISFKSITTPVQILFDFMLFTLQTILFTLKILLTPFVVLYKLDKKSRVAFQKEQAHQKKIDEARKKARRKPGLWFTVKIFFWGVAFSAFFVFLPVLSLIFLTDLPNPSTLTLNSIPKTTKIFDRNGILLYEIFANQNRTIVPLSKIPKNLIHATIAIEDRDFYTHPGFDIKGIARAFMSNATSDNLQGGSTITQQLVKSSLLTSDPTITRKIKEIVLAFWSERIYNKNKILELYFNYVPYGGTAWGVEAASEVYFGKHVEELNLSESAFLAGLTRAPSVYSPYSKYADAWKKRQKDVLQAMVKAHYISSKEANTAGNTSLSFSGPNNSIKAPHFVMFVKSLLEQKYGISEVERGGLQVKTSLDLATQNMVQDTVAQEVDSDSYLDISNGASLVINPKNGDILAMVGSKNYFDLEHDGNVNLTTAPRQPGSTIKVVTYSLALASGFTQATLLDDSPLTITPAQGPSYTPVNYDGRFHGRLPLRLAFANSLNIPAVRVAQKLGVENIVNQGKRLGITTWNNPEKYGLSITLGAAETTMLDLATVYGTIANYGEKVEPNPILEVKNSQGEILYKKTPVGSQILNSGVAFIISDILSDNAARSIEFGLNSPLMIPNHRVSVKTGTTDSKRDNWTVGFTPNIVVATWVGNNDNSPMSQQLASGITGAAPMWNKIMTSILSRKSEEPILIPEDIVKKKCFGNDLYFISGTEQNASCTIPPATSPNPTSITTARTQWQ